MDIGAQTAAQHYGFIFPLISPLTVESEAKLVFYTQLPVTDNDTVFVS